MDRLISFADWANRDQVYLAPYARLFSRTEFHIVGVCRRVPQAHDLVHQRQGEVVRCDRVHFDGADVRLQASISRTNWRCSMLHPSRPTSPLRAGPP